MTDLILSIKIYNSNKEYVFGREDGKPYTNVRKLFDGLLKVAKIKNFHFHDLRHTFASYLALSGTDIITLKELLGHTKITTTERYTHSTDGVKRSAVSLLDRRFSVDTYMDTIGKKEVKLAVKRR